MGNVTRQMSIGVFLLGVGHHISSWRDPLARPDQLNDFEFYKHIAQTAERGKLDMLFIADRLAVTDRYDAIIKHSINTHLEPITLLSSLIGVTEKIGLAATVSTSFAEPYHLAREIASLDHLSGGRVAWNVVTTAEKEEALNFRDEHFEHAHRYERAQEFVDVVTGLWDSWQDDAIVEDRISRVFANPSAIHKLQHQGKEFRIEGPLNIPPTPQGRPVLIQAGASEAGQYLAARNADVIFTAWHTMEEAQLFYKSVHSKLESVGRETSSMKILPGIYPVIGSSEKEAKEKAEYMHSLLIDSLGLAWLSIVLATDLTTCDLDAPLPELPDLDKVNAGRGRFQLVSDMAKREGLNVRQLIKHMIGSRGHKTVYGTASQVADQMQLWFENDACDGFNILPPHFPSGFEQFVDSVIPELQARGIYRQDYEGSQLRQHLNV
ncbi:LLM class flavin-dependent oxidoreductase [Paenibacillus endoradicis]|uniref:LLM class flavin-dependent oxidoreductase n=1 Tax=Paenibacillus endoradicis TaxID=2972487 RepID=UPI0021594383|nr:LLM class flavin-dependent oxidoreductase [Paenibacillus endoradicis]MCR8655965.1 LLM class flavin-dependent oxidoreductase [Paenibacillus endoradicis]MCR8658291.1 LLM class flavin-dependent oxidoreductase [Paenibacillus endoradicis]